MKKVTVEQLSEILAGAEKNEVVYLKARNGSNGLNSKPTNGDIEKGKNPYYKSDDLVKVMDYYGKINFDYQNERRAETGDQTYEATKSHGMKLGGLTMTPKGPAISMIGVKNSNVEWYLNGAKLTDEQVQEIVDPYKPVKKEPTTDNATDNVRLIYVSNLYWIEVGGQRYEVA